MATTNPKAKTTSFILSPSDQRLLAILTKKMGVNVSNIVRMGIRKVAEHEGLKVA